MDEDLDPILEKLVYGKPLTPAQFEKNLEFIAETRGRDRPVDRRSRVAGLELPRNSSEPAAP